LLRKRWPVPAVTVVLGVAAAFVYTARQPKIYEAGCSPPTALVTDPAILGSITDGVILVLRAGHTTREDALHARKDLTVARAKILGLIVNQTDRRGGRYGYGYSHYALNDRYYGAA
jgi:succinoglycan biosynthesis transport protein ExoP